MERQRHLGEGLGVVLATLVAAVGLAGCGGGSSSPGASASTSGTTSSASATSSSTASVGPAHALSRAQLTASATTICKRAEAEIAGVKAKNASVAEIVRVVPQHAAVERRAAVELGRLVPPPEIARDWALIVAYRSSLASELTQLVVAARSNDTAKIRALSASKSRAHGRLVQAAKRAGLSACGLV